MNERPKHKFLPPPKERDPEPSGFRFPGPRDRVTVNGMSGSGKSTFAIWLFAESADYDKKPWLFIDYKKEDLIQAALAEELFKPLDIGASMPKNPGAYVVSPDVKAGPQPVVDFLWRVYDKGRIGVFLDEATMIPELRGQANTGGPFQSLLSQGRSKEIPVWTLAQRPVHVNNMVLTENNFYCAFRLRSMKDLDKVKDEIPHNSRGFEQTWSEDWTPPPHWSRWYDAERDLSMRLRPCPPPDEILGILFERLDKAEKNRSI